MGMAAVDELVLLGHVVTDRVGLDKNVEARQGIPDR